MPTSTMTSKGQITLPKEVREHFHLKAGDQVEFRIESGGTVGLRPVSGSILSLYGALHRPGASAASVKEMDDAVGRYLAEDDERIRKGRA
ncbi:MAG TPA: AbrB/MazE/SpoVT family DNA-binding domain-containing protein [Thermoanaerobaculia bacterium]|jgi:AbrB family looped-hinge helix DNA binding protein|nr:AbrB/MazE/SpoVT family DNA-binding domain-containing protein [Thermoanaerobaculia bacterium]